MSEQVYNYVQLTSVKILLNDQSLNLVLCDNATYYKHVTAHKSFHSEELHMIKLNLTHGTMDENDQLC